MLNSGCFNTYQYNSTFVWSLQSNIFINSLISHIGQKSIEIQHPDNKQTMFYSDIIPLNSGNPITQTTNYVLSSYVQGNGLGTMRLRGYTQGASGVNDITSFQITDDHMDFNATTPGWQRPNFMISVPSGVAYVRTFMSCSGLWLRADDFQLEKSNVVTSIEEDFVSDLILPKKLVKAEIGFNQDNCPKFVGLIDEITPDIKNDTVHIHAYDLADKCKDFLVTTELFENKRSDELIAILADACGIPASERNLQIGVHTSKYAWFPEASAWTYMNQIAEAEGGRVFFDEQGKLTFWNRTTVDYQTGNPVYNFTFDNTLSISYAISKNNVKNRVSVIAKPKTLLPSTTIYEDTTSPSIAVGETKEFWCQFSHGTEGTVPALNVEYPIIGVDIKGNTESDGSGYEVISQLEITSTSIFAESFRINIKNNYTQPVYLYFFELYGEPIVMEKQIEIISEDPTSQGLYDVQELSIENNFIDDEIFAKSLADAKLAAKKDPRNFLEIETIGVPYLQVGDLVSVKENYDGEIGNYTIIKNSWQLDGDFIQKLTLEKKITI